MPATAVQTPAVQTPGVQTGGVQTRRVQTRRVQIEEDAAIWTRAWVCVGFDADLPKAGDILPFTVGDHGIHVERLADGGLAARFNKAQHGGCRSVPVQCQTGTKTRCSFTACGYSRDRGPIAADAGDRDASLDQYLGLRPERLLPVRLQRWGPLLAAQLDPAAAAAFAWPDLPVLPPRTRAPTRWISAAANWKQLAGQLAGQLATGPLVAAGADHAATATAMVLFPNVVVLAGQGSAAIVVLQPIALDQTLCRIRFYGTNDAHERQVLAAITGVGAGGDAAVEPLGRWFGDRSVEAMAGLQALHQTHALYRTDDKGGW